eukprot:Opistho-2@89861
MPTLTENLVLQLSKASDLKHVTVLNCWGKEIDNIDIVRHMPNLEKVTLSLNQIASLAPLSACSRITELYLRRNRIDSLAELEHLRGLTRLHTLWLKDNPVASLANYRRGVIRILPSLRHLDDSSVDTAEVVESANVDAPPFEVPKDDATGGQLHRAATTENMDADESETRSDAGSVEELAVDTPPTARSRMVPTKPFAPADARSLPDKQYHSAVSASAFSEDNADHALTAIFALLNIVTNDRARLRVVKEEVERHMAMLPR